MDKISIYKGIYYLLRMKQWTKNIFIFFPLLFSGKLIFADAREDSLLTFLGFCLIASSLYIFNDLKDIEKDKVHPDKKIRALRLEKTNKVLLFFVIIVLQLGGLLLCQAAGPAVAVCAGIYVLILLTYNYIAKKISGFDVAVIALGFLVRIWAGAMAIFMNPAMWLQVCVFSTALFLGFVKRRQELLLLEGEAAEHRKVLKYYSVALLENLCVVCALLAVFAYVFYVMFPQPMSGLDAKGSAYSVGFVVLGFWRYMHLSRHCGRGGDPSDVMVKDLPMILCVVLWLIYMGVIIY